MKSQNNVEEDEAKYSQMEKLIAMSKDENILYCTSSDNDLYIITNRNRLLIFEKYTKSLNSSQINAMQTIVKKEEKFQSKEIMTKIWCNKTGDHVIIRKDKSVFYYNPLCKTDFNLKEINLEYNSKYYIEPYSIAFNEELKSKDEFEILITDYFSDIYNLRAKMNNKNEIIIIYFEKVFTFKTKFELEQEKLLEEKEKLIEKKEENKINNDESELNLDLDFDPMELINFEQNERILDMKIYNNEKDKEKIIIACTRNMLFKFIGKENTLKEIFLKYSTNSELILKSYRNFPNKFSANNIYSNNTYLQIIQSYTNNSINDLIFGCKGSYGYCIGKIIPEKNNNNINENMFIIQSHKPKYLGEKKIPLFTLTDEEKKNKDDLILICQSKLYLYYLYENCLLMMNKLTLQYANVYMLPYKFKDVFYTENNNMLFLYNENEIFKISCKGEDKYVWSNYIQIQKYDLALNSISNTNIVLKSKVHKLFAEFYFNKKKYELAGKEYALSNEKFEHVCYKFLRQGKTEGLITYLKMIKDYKLNDNQTINNELFINKYLVYTWLSTLLISEEKSENNEKKESKFWSEFNSYQKDKYLNRQSIYRYLKINKNEKELNDFATLKNDHKIIIQNLIFKGKYDEAFNYIEKTLSNGKDNLEECIKTFMKYFDLFISKSVKNTMKLLDNITFSIHDQKQLVNALMEIDYNKYIIEDEEKNFNLIINYLKKIIYENITSNFQNKNLNNLFLLFLSLSKKDENKKEIINYLKSPLNTYILKENKISTLFSNKKIFLDFNFAEKILKDIPQALALIYFYMKKYEKSINILLDKNEDELAIQLAQNIKSEEKKKKIWMKLFKQYKNKKYTSKQILILAGGSLKIEDVLQSLDTEIKLKEIKDDLQSCIDVYEQGVTSIKQNIISFNKSNNSIQENIFFTKKRKFELNQSNIKCRKCGNIITDNKFFLYPCGHIFDVECSVKILIDYENKNIENKELKSRIKAVKNLSTKIMNMQKKKTEGKRTSIIMDGLSEIGKKTKGAMKRFITFVKKEEKKSIWDEKVDDKEEVELSREEEIQLKELSNGLYDLLKSECVLCGQEMINSTQNIFEQNTEDKWGNLVE